MNGNGRIVPMPAGRAEPRIETIPLAPMLDELEFVPGMGRLEGYREVFAAWCRCPSEEIVDVEYDALGIVALREVVPVVRASWRGRVWP